VLRNNEEIKGKEREFMPVEIPATWEAEIRKS
jgi:hypothetical protein